MGSFSKKGKSQIQHCFQRVFPSAEVSEDQCSMWIQTYIQVCLGLSTKCQAEDEVRGCLWVSSSIAEPPAQFNTTGKSKSRRDQKTGFLSQKEMPFPPDFRLKAKIEVKVLKYFPEWKFWNIPRWIFLFALMCGPKIRTKIEPEEKQGENKYLIFKLFLNFLWNSWISSVELGPVPTAPSSARQLLLRESSPRLQFGPRSQISPAQNKFRGIRVAASQPGQKYT